ncbi:MAG: PD-(D/E)XK nuclease family protein [Selenomonadales bacterium]|nr:PD-(D/E)XK nuclease family protein [Selenomonadales bacterium]
MAVEALQTEGEELIPAGVLYYFLRQPFITAKRRITSEQAWAEVCKERRMPGWLLKEKEILQSLDATLGESSDFLQKISLKKDGDYKAQSLPYLKTADEFKELCAYTADILRRTGEEILGGDIALQPVVLKDLDACAYCSYRSVCGFDETLAENRKTRLDEMSDEEAMDRMRTEGRESDGMVGKTTRSN